jgi:ornithine cyclodeaminase/alanine dehydrogenase-like protein (mu-crystallin family)
VEIGDIIAGGAVGRSSDEQITVFDSTGVAVQDIAIVEAVHEAMASSARAPEMPLDNHGPRSGGSRQPRHRE